MRQLMRRFAKSDAGSEMAEFALALAVFSIAALGGWGVIATAADARQNTMQNNLSNVSVNPP